MLSSLLNTEGYSSSYCDSAVMVTAAKNVKNKIH